MYKYDKLFCIFRRMSFASRIHIEVCCHSRSIRQGLIFRSLTILLATWFAFFFCYCFLRFRMSLLCPYQLLRRTCLTMYLPSTGTIANEARKKSRGTRFAPSIPQTRNMTISWRPRSSSACAISDSQDSLPSMKLHHRKWRNCLQPDSKECAVVVFPSFAISSLQEGFT